MKTKKSLIVNSDLYFMIPSIRPILIHLILTKNLTHRKFPRVEVDFHHVLLRNRRAKSAQQFLNHHRHFVCNVFGVDLCQRLCHHRQHVGRSTCCQKDTRPCLCCSIYTPFSTFGICNQQRVFLFPRVYQPNVLKDKCNLTSDGIPDKL